MGYRFFSSSATVSGENQLRLFDGVEVGGEDEAVGDGEAYGSDWQWRAWSGVAGAEGGGEHVPDFGGVHGDWVEGIGCADEGFGEVIFDIRLPKAPRKNWEVPDNGFLTSCYSSANSGAVDASELPPHETASETLR